MEPAPEQFGWSQGYRQFADIREGVSVISGYGDAVGHYFVEKYYGDPVYFHPAVHPLFQSGHSTLGNAVLQLWKLQGDIAGERDDTDEDYQAAEYFSKDPYGILNFFAFFLQAGGGQFEYQHKCNSYEGKYYCKAYVAGEEWLKVGLKRHYRAGYFSYLELPWPYFDQ